MGHNKREDVGQSNKRTKVLTNAQQAEKPKIKKLAE